MSIVQTGLPGPVLGPKEIDWKFGQGYSSVFIYRGLRSEIEAAFATLTVGAQSANIRSEGSGPMATLTVNFGNAMDGTQGNQDNLVTTTWTLAGNSLEKQLFSHAKFAALTTAEQDALRAFKNGTSTVTTGITSSDGLLFLAEIRKGTEGYQLSQYVLRQVKIIDPAWTSQIGVSNVGKYYATTAALLAAEPTIPTIIIPTFPDGMWLKQTPTIAQQSNGKFESSQEWWYAVTWSALLYDQAS